MLNMPVRITRREVRCCSESRLRSGIPGIYRVRVEGEVRSSNCDAYSDIIELILRPSHDEIVSKDACPGKELYIRLNIDTTLNMNMSYTILFRGKGDG